MATPQFYAARFYDPEYHKEIPVFLVETSSKESLLQAVDAISNSTYTPEQIHGMLAVVLGNASEMFTDEERASLFGEVSEPSEDPYTIELTSENFQVLYNLCESLSTPTEVTWTYKLEAVEAPTDELDALKSEVERLTAELEAAKAEQTEEPEEAPDAAGSEPEPAADTNKEGEQETDVHKARIAELEAELSEKNQTIASLMVTVSDLKSRVHESLAHEAARLALALGKAISKGKSYDELVSVLSARTDESLSDMISDFTLELGAALSAKPEEDEEVEEAEEVAIPRVDDPTKPDESEDETDENGTTIPTRDDVAAELHSKIEDQTEEEDDDIYMVWGVKPAADKPTEE